jgi:hypothetical protein
VNKIKNKIYRYFIKKANNKSLDINIKNIIFDLLHQIGFNITYNNKKYIENNNNINEKKEKKDIEHIIIKNNENDMNNKKYIKNKQKTNHNKNVNIEIFVKKDNNKNQKPVNRQFTPLNTYKKKIESISDSNNNNNKNKKDKFISTFINDEEDYINPIKIWYNFDNNSRKNIKDERNKKQKGINAISINKSINNSQINIINQTKEEPKLELIMNEIMKISKLQNSLSEKINSLEKNTHKQISYFNSRIDELEKTISNNELIENNNIMDNDNILLDKKMINESWVLNTNESKVIYPSNYLNEQLIAFLNMEDIDKSIYCLKGITEEQMIKIDNNLIEDVLIKLIGFLEMGIYIHESISFIKKVFIKNKMKFKLNTIKRLLGTLDTLLINKDILSNEDSFDISLIISSINIEKL